MKEKIEKIIIEAQLGNISSWKAEQQVLDLFAVSGSALSPVEWLEKEVKKRFGGETFTSVFSTEFEKAKQMEKMNKTKLLEIAQALNLGTIDDERARTFKVGDNVKWRGMDLVVVEVGIGEILIATSENVEDDNYNDWWVGTQYVC